MRPSSTHHTNRLQHQRTRSAKLKLGTRTLKLFYPDLSFANVSIQSNNRTVEEMEPTSPPPSEPNPIADSSEYSYSSSDILATRRSFVSEALSYLTVAVQVRHDQRNRGNRRAQRKIELLLTIDTAGTSESTGQCAIVRRNFPRK